MKEFRDQKLGRWHYSMTWALVDGVERPFEFWACSMDTPPRHFSRQVRDALIKEELDHRAEGADVFRVAAGSGEWDALRSEAFRKVADRLEANPRGGNLPVSEEFLREVAVVYSIAVKETPEGKRPAPRRAVAEWLARSRGGTVDSKLPVASKYIDLARKKEFLDPAPGRGKAGEKKGDD